MVIRNVRENEGRVLLEVLEHLRSGAQGSPVITVHVLVATDHDGVCSQMIFDILLQRYEVNASWFPVTGNTEVINHIRELDDQSTVKSLVLLNCGASIDLASYLAESPIRCFVIDAHRPLLLANLKESNDRVFILDDDPIIDESLRPPVDDSESEGEADEGSEGEKENEWDPNGGENSRFAEDDRQRKRRRLSERRERQESRKRRIYEYYLNSYFAMPAAMSLFKMARQSAKPSPDLLWLAAVSLVGYHELGLLGEVEYGRLACSDLNDVLEDAENLAPAAEAEVSAPANLVTESRSKPPPRGLRFERDLRLTIYRHWTLEESIMHSSYFYGTLELHRDKGLRSLKSLFAEMGLPPIQYKQQYQGMALSMKKKIHDTFKKHGKSIGLTDKMFLQQFVRQTLEPLGEKYAALGMSEISALDAFYVINGLLCYIPPSLGVAQVDQLPKTSDGRRDADQVHEMERSAMVENFWHATKAVLCKDPHIMREGLAQAVRSAQAVQSLARYVIDTKSLRLSTSNQFRWCKVEQPADIFRHHVCVRRLAIWLMNVLFTYRPKCDAPERPLLLIVRDYVRHSYVCVGASPARTAEQNDFGERFRTVLRSDKSLKFRYDFFDKACIEISADDFDRFWDTLVEAVV